MQRGGKPVSSARQSAGGMDEGDAMKITGHQTEHVFRRYDLGNVDALHQRLTSARTKAATVTRLRGTQKQRVAHGQAAGSCTAGACDDGRGRIKPADAGSGG